MTNPFGPGNPLPSMRQLRKLAKKLERECPQLKKVYLAQKEQNPDLDKEVSECIDDLKESTDDI